MLDASTSSLMISCVILLLLVTVPLALAFVLRKVYRPKAKAPANKPAKPKSGPVDPNDWYER